MEQVEMLPLVFMQTLYLHIEDCLGVDLEVAKFSDNRSKGLFVASFCSHETLLKILVLSVFFQAAQFVQIYGPIAANGFVDKFG